jgi:hypothetical protein
MLSASFVQSNFSWAQQSPLLDNGNNETVLSRIIKSGCSARHIQGAIVNASLGNLASWLERERRPQEASRVRGIERVLTEGLAQIEEAQNLRTVKYVLSLGKGTEWDAETLLTSAVQTLGGEAEVTRIVAATRDARLAAFKAPADAFYRNSPLNPDMWAEDNPSQGLSEIKGNDQLLSMRTSIRLPLTFYRYMIEGKGYANPIIGARADAPLYVAPEARSAYQVALEAASLELIENSKISQRAAVARIVKKEFSETGSTPELVDRPLVYVASLSNICITANLVTASTYLAQSVIEKRYIPDLKEAGKW